MPRLDPLMQGRWFGGRIPEGLGGFPFSLQLFQITYTIAKDVHGGLNLRGGVSIDDL